MKLILHTNFDPLYTNQTILYFNLYSSQYKLVFDSDNEVDIGSYFQMIGDWSWGYIDACLGTMINEQKFVITKSFRELVENFNDGFKILTINGPKGVGKSLALAAICALNKGKSPCLVISPLTTMSSGYFHNYVKEVYAQHGKSKCFIGGNCSRFLIFPLSGVTIQWPLYHSYSYNTCIVSHLPNASRQGPFFPGGGGQCPKTQG